MILDNHCIVNDKKFSGIIIHTCHGIVDLENLKDKVIKAGEKVSNNLFKITYKNGIFDPYTGFQAIDLKGVKLVVKMAKV